MSKIILRPFTTDDINSLYEMLSDNETVRFMPIQPFKTIRDATSFYENVIKRNIENGGKYYAIVLDSTVIGQINLSSSASNDIGYSIKRAHWGHGYASKALSLLIKEIEEEGKLSFITATHDVNNPRSGRVMQKVGLVYKYTYIEPWCKGFDVSFRLYQKNFKDENFTYMEYWEKYERHFIEEI